MHRPILFSKTASTATFISTKEKHSYIIGIELNAETADYINNNIRSDTTLRYSGEVTGYNSNSCKGRIYVESERRILSSFLDERCRSASDLFAITNSLTANAQNSERYESYAKIQFEAFAFRSKSGRIKSLHIVSIG
jgi:hypothetical protein